jgi:hypothetical protein
MLSKVSQVLNDKGCMSFPMQEIEPIQLQASSYIPIYDIYIYIEHMYIGVYIHRTYFQKSEINERG